MSVLFFVAIVVFVIRAVLRQLGGVPERQPGGRKSGGHARRRPAAAPDRFRPRTPPPPTAASRRAPATPPLTVEAGSTARPAPPVDDPAEAVIEPVPPPPAPEDPVVIEQAAPEPPDEPTVGREPTAASGTVPDLTLHATLTTLFGRDEPPHERAARFEADYLGRTVEWTVTAVRTARSRRDREPAIRADLVLGHLTERQLFSDRVVAEAYFAPDIELESDAEITIRGTLSEANVYANRLVLDDCTVVGAASSAG